MNTMMWTSSHAVAYVAPRANPLSKRYSSVPQYQISAGADTEGIVGSVESEVRRSNEADYQVSLLLLTYSGP